LKPQINGSGLRFFVHDSAVKAKRYDLTFRNVRMRRSLSGIFMFGKD
jgi:hypothetical protein